MTNLNEDDDDTTIPDGGSVRIPMMMRDGVMVPDHDNARVVRAVVLDAYQQFVADRDAWRAKQFDELRKITTGEMTPAFGAALMRRQEAWDARGAEQSKAWQERPAPLSNTTTPKPLAANASLADTIAARDAAWAKRGEEQANAWRR
jgi:hypothetical protein